MAIRDEETAEGFQWTYDSSLTIVALEPGDTIIAAAEPGRKAPTGQSTRIDLPYTGSGWILSAPPSITLDRRHEHPPTPLTDLALPFFMSIEGAGTAEILPSATKCSLIDAFEIGDSEAVKQRRFAVQNMSKLIELDSCFPDGSHRKALVASHLNKASWFITVPSPNDGLLLRRTYDRFHGRQRARVFLDGTYAGYWYEPVQDRECRWYISDFGVPPHLVAGKQLVEIAIDPPPGTPLWSISRMEAYALSHG
ncbi:MAG: hypothetical protein ACAH95_13605 [Fimbriimonas sp.]